MPIHMDIKLDDFLNALYALEGETTNTVAQRALLLQTQGWKFGFQMFLVSASYNQVSPAVQIPENMPALIPAMMSQKITGQQLTTFRLMFEKFISQVEAAHANIQSGLHAAPKAADPVATSAAAKKAETLKKIVGGSKVNPEATYTMDPSGAVAAQPAQPAKKAVDGVVKLRDATVLGQMVFGTSEGSYYKTVAIGPVNIASKIGTGAVSLRVEGQLTPSVVKILAEMGFSKKTEYMSMHCSLSPTLPASRVIGAVVMGLNMTFQAVITNGAELK